MSKYTSLVDLNHLETGDMLLFHQEDQCNSCMSCLFSCFTDCIMCCTNSRYSHSAIVVRDPSWAPELKGLYIIESSYEPYGDSENHEIKLGCLMVPLEKMVGDFHGKVYWRHIDCDRNDEFYTKFQQAHSVVHNRPYDLDPIDWIDAKFKISLTNPRRKDTFFCSAMVTYFYTELGLLDSNTKWTLQSCENLGTEHPKDELKFKNCTIYKEVRIK